MSDDLTISLRRRSRPVGDPGRPLGTSAATGGAVAALATLGACMAVALIAWYLADAGAHGATTDALRAGADTWLIGHGSRFDLSGQPIGMTPLGLTMLILVGAFRSGRRSAARAEAPYDDRALGLAAAAFAGAYVVITVLVCVLASQAGAEPGLGRSVLGAVLVAVVGGGLGLSVGSGRFYDWTESVPGWLREVVAAAFTGALALFAAGAVLVAVSLVLSFDEAANVMSALGLSPGEAITLAFVTALFAPNAALFGSSYLLGPGFALGSIAHGVTTSVSPAAPVVLGAVPAVPLLAALPKQGPTPGWLIVICIVPVLCSAAGVIIAGRYSERLPYDLAAIRGAGAGFGSAVLIALAISMSGGPMGVDRLANIGAPMGETLVFAIASMTIGGIAGGLVQSWRQRRR